MIAEPKPPYTSPGQVKIYTDGGAQNNPGPGGYGVVLLFGKYRKDLSGGFRQTTNNRMELLACIEGLKALTKPCEVTIYSDSKYVVDAINKGWLAKWKSNGWKLSNRKSVENMDLWQQFLIQLDTHSIRFEWVKGHSGDFFNEICDQLASKAYSQNDLAVDEGYELRNKEHQLALFDA